MSPLIVISWDVPGYFEKSFLTDIFLFLNMNVAIKTSKYFVTLVEALKKLRSKYDQNIRVERVNVY